MMKLALLLPFTPSGPSCWLSFACTVIELVPGSGAVQAPAFFGYAYPEPPGFRDASPGAVMAITSKAREPASALSTAPVQTSQMA